MLLDKLLAPSMLGTYAPNRWTLSGTASFLSGRQSSAGATVNEEEALSLSAVFAACRLLSQTIGALPRSVMKKTGDRKEHATSHPAYKVLHNSLNPEMTAFVGCSTLEFHRLLWGNCYAEVQWDGGGNCRAIWPIEPWRVRPDRDDNDQLYYKVDGERNVSPADMIHVPLISFDGVCGRSFVEFAVESLGLGISAQEFAARYFGNGAKPGGILKHPGTPKKEARDEFRKSWTETHGGAGNANKTAVVWGGWEYDPADGTANAQESQLLETRRFTTEEVARWLNIPPHLLRDLSRATFSNIEQQQIELVMYTLQPVCVAYEQEWDRKLLNPPDLYCKHNLTALMRGDSAARSTFYREMRNIGVLNSNEIRDLEDMNPIDGGELYFVPVNLQSLEQAMRAAEEPPPEPAPAPPMPGQAPADPNAEQPPTDQPPMPEPSPPDLGAKRRLLTHTLGRMLRKETNAARRAAAKPDSFLSWMDEFYPKHAVTMADALAPVLPLLIPDGESQAPAVAKTFTEASYQELLDLSGTATPATFASVVDGRMAEWETSRPQAAAALILGA